MNYIKHLNTVFLKFHADKRLNPTHISLYMALFLYWNMNRFPNEFYINKQNIMQLSKIGSNPTYHRCLKQMNNWKYLKYMPSHNPFKGSKIKMFIFDTTYEQVENNHETSHEQVLTSNTNINKQIENINKLKLPKNKIEVINFFKNEKWPVNEAEKFYNHYQGIGWKIGGKIKIENWQAIASNWILKANEFKTVKTVHQKMDNLRTIKNKDYGQPL